MRRCELFNDRSRCNTAEIAFDDCTPDNQYCTQAPSTTATFALIISAFGVIIFGTVVGLIRPHLHWIPVFTSFVMVVTAVSLYAFSSHLKYNESIKELMSSADLFPGAKASDGFGWSFICACVSAGLLGIGSVFALIGMVTVRRSGVANQQVMSVEMTATQVNASAVPVGAHEAGFTHLASGPEGHQDE